MIKLKELISEVKFTKPNFDYEWEEAERYPKLFPDKQTWLDAVKSGVEVEVDCGMNIQNTDMCEPDVDLEPAKVDRVQKMVDSGNIELPIVMKYKGKYELIGGNTRLVALKKAGLPTKAWVFNYE
jgi:hypothetical protein|tara:strand:+ start:90 stop:464 length:375 start_codon:yes stop_codon:yes gene_type:complete